MCPVFVSSSSGRVCMGSVVHLQQIQLHLQHHYHRSIFKKKQKLFSLNEQAKSTSTGLLRIVGHRLPALRVLSPWLFISMAMWDVCMSEEAKPELGMYILA